MADRHDIAVAPASDAEPDAVDPAVAPEEWSRWSNLWQVPAIAIALVSIGLGLHVAGLRAPAEDWSAVLSETESLVAGGDLDEALTRLKTVLEPNIGRAAPPLQSRFHALVADYVDARQVEAGVDLVTNHEAIAEHYVRASTLGLRLSPERLRRLGVARIATGRLEAARGVLAELEARMGVDEPGASAARNQVLRGLVDAALRERQPGDLGAVEATIDRYRSDGALAPDDRAWAAARLAEIRLAEDEPGAMVDGLLIDMRRLEPLAPPLPDRRWGELLTLLGRGYAALGRDAEARFALERAFARLDEAAPERAEALLALAWLDLGSSEPVEAVAALDTLIDRFPGLPAELPGRLARATARGMLGDHDGSLSDFEAVARALADHGPARGVDVRRAASSLVDRHDAAMAAGELELALRYADRAEALFDGDDVPPDVLRRIAATSRQIGDDLLDGVPEEAAEPALRHRAALFRDRAARAFLRHARTLAAVPTEEADLVAGAAPQWAESLWMAGDCFDLAGRGDESIGAFREYVESRPIDDPRRAEATWRLARALEAAGEFDEAARAYEKTIQEHPRSHFGTGSHVPLARCYAASGRFAEAEQQLLDIVEGRNRETIPLDPEAEDYRVALVELGILYHRNGRWSDAIGRLTAAAERDPGDPRILEVRFRLADAHRRRAGDLEARLRDEPRLTPTERAGYAAEARVHLESSRRIFDVLCAAYAAIDETTLDRAERGREREAWMGRAHAAFELGDWSDAAELYDRVARRWPDETLALEALVQIVACFDRLGDAAQAEVAHRNALVRLQQLSDDAFADPSAVMSRATWERWLRARTPGGLAAATGEETP